MVHSHVPGMDVQSEAIVIKGKGLAVVKNCYGKIPRNGD